MWARVMPGVRCFPNADLTEFLFIWVLTILLSLLLFWFFGKSPRSSRFCLKTEKQKFQSGASLPFYCVAVYWPYFEQGPFRIYLIAIGRTQIMQASDPYTSACYLKEVLSAC